MDPGARGWTGQDDALAAQRGREPAQQVRLDLGPGIADVDDPVGGAGRSRAGAAASSARSMPYFAISSAALAVSACASAAVTPASSALASSLRTRASSGSATWEFTQCLRPVERVIERYRRAMTVSAIGVTCRTLPVPATRAGPSRAAFHSGTGHAGRWPSDPAGPDSPRRHPRGARAAVYTRPYGRADQPQHPVRRLRPSCPRRQGRLWKARTGSMSTSWTTIWSRTSRSGCRSWSLWPQRDGQPLDCHLMIERAPRPVGSPVCGSRCGLRNLPRGGRRRSPSGLAP